MFPLRILHVSANAFTGLSFNCKMTHLALRPALPLGLYRRVPFASLRVKRMPRSEQ
jgi:hypothetical protein